MRLSALYPSTTPAKNWSSAGHCTSTRLPFSLLPSLHPHHTYIRKSEVLRQLEYLKHDPDLPAVLLDPGAQSPSPNDPDSFLGLLPVPHPGVLREPVSCVDTAARLRQALRLVAAARRGALHEQLVGGAAVAAQEQPCGVRTRGSRAYLQRLPLDSSSS